MASFSYVELVLRECLGVRPGDTVLVVTDDLLFDFAKIFYDCAIAMGQEALLARMRPRDLHGNEPPAAIAEAMTKCSVCLLITRSSLSHTEARRRACREFGARIASMPNADPERMPTLLNIDYPAMHAHCRRIADMMEKASEIRLTTEMGTDITMRIAGRKAEVESGIYTEPGAFGNLPAGEVSVSPVEGTANGLLMVDGSIAWPGRMTAPVRVEVRDGNVVKTDCDALNELLNAHGPQARNIAEVGFGANPAASIVGNVLEDEKALATTHVAFGDNRSFGGTVAADCHIDAVMTNPLVFLDGAQVPPEVLLGSVGRSKTARVLPASLPIFRPEPETFRLLFEDSNDAQYVLDYNAQTFIECNPAFEKLTGYHREEVIRGAMVARELIAEESHDVYDSKVRQRREIASERYEIRIRCKSGDVKLVEVSVRRATIGMRTVVVGSLRDLTEQEENKKTLMKQREQAMINSNRIYTLTEKIRNVPALTPMLLAAADEQQAIERAGEFLCHREGMGYVEAVIYMLKDDRLVPAFKSAKKGIGRLGAARQRKLLGILRGEVPPQEEGTEIILPLKGKEQALGLMEVQLYVREKELMDGVDIAKKGYINVLRMLASAIGLAIENIRLYETVKAQSTTDGLTQVRNRRYLSMRLADEITRARRYSRDMSLLIADLDNLKPINDKLGHRQGDLVLQELASIFVSNTRATDMVCRYGGDEFVIILPETSLPNAFHTAELLLKKVIARRVRNVTNPRKPLKISVSIGVGSISSEITTEDALLRVADQSLYEAKNSGKSRVHALQLPSAGKPRSKR